jgi:hypothetical protein
MSTRLCCVCAALAVGALLVDVRVAAQQRDRAVAAKIAALSARLHEEPENEERDELAAAIRQEVATFVESDLSPSDPSELLQQRLRTLLRSQVPDFDSSDPPNVRVGNLRHGRSVIVAYSIVRPPHHDAATLTAFTDRGGRFARPHQLATSSTAIR